MERCSQLKAFFGTGNLYAWKKILNKGYVVKEKKKRSPSYPRLNHPSSHWNQITVNPYKDSITSKLKHKRAHTRKLLTQRVAYHTHCPWFFSLNYSKMFSDLSYNTVFLHHQCILLWQIQVHSRTNTRSKNKIFLKGILVNNNSNSSAKT